MNGHLGNPVRLLKDLWVRFEPVHCKKYWYRKSFSQVANAKYCSLFLFHMSKGHLVDRRDIIRVVLFYSFT